MCSRFSQLRIQIDNSNLKNQETRVDIPPSIILGGAPSIFFRDGDLSFDQKDALVRKFRPIFVFDEQEQYYPVNFSEYAHEIQFKDLSVQFNDIEKYTGPLHYQYGLESKFIRDYHPSEEELKRIPVYVSFRTIFPPVVNHLNRESTVLITYAIMFAYNGGSKYFGCWNRHSHFVDIQYVTIELLCQNEPKHDKAIIKRVYFSRHKGGKWIDHSCLCYHNNDKESNTILVYVSRNNHALYPQLGVFSRHFWVSRDICSNHKKFESELTILIPSDLENCELQKKWMFYSGDLSNGYNVKSLALQSFTEHVDMNDEYGITCCQRLFCKLFDSKKQCH